MSTPTPRVGLVNLGCPKALVDSKRIPTQLRMEGHKVVPTCEDADAVVISTCGFVDNAKAGSLEVTGEAIAENGKVIVTDCTGAEEHAICDVHPSVLTITGLQRYEQMITAMHGVVLPKTEHNPLVSPVPPQGVKLTPRHYAYLKIPEGYSHNCNFRIISPMHGKSVSRPVDDVLNEVERLTKTRVKGLLVISQDTSTYGVNLKYKTGSWNGQPTKTRMKELCEVLSSMGVWARLHYVYPYPNVDDVVPLMAAGKLLSYLGIPFRYVSPKVLKAMECPAFENKILARIKQWRETCPELTICSTFIVGFLGETEEDFQYLPDRLTKAQLDHVGYFQYSPVKGALANELGLEPVPDGVRQDRWECFVTRQWAISTAHLQLKVGKEIEVLIGEVDGQDAVDRSWADVPKVDDNMSADSNELKPGDKVRARVTDADEYDLWAELV